MKKNNLCFKKLNKWLKDNQHLATWIAIALTILAILLGAFYLTGFY